MDMDTGTEHNLHLDIKNENECEIEIENNSTEDDERVLKREVIAYSEMIKQDSDNKVDYLNGTVKDCDNLNYRKLTVNNDSIPEGDTNTTDRESGGIPTINTTITQNKSVQCEIGNLASSTNKDLKKHDFSAHYNVNNKVPPFSCLTCKNRSYNKFKKLYYHLRDTHKPPVTCPKCGKGINPRRFVRHLKTHDKLQQLNQCKICGKSVKHLDVHIKFIHQREKYLNHKCEICGKVFCTAVTLKRHVGTHSGVPYRRRTKRELPFPCKICRKRLTTAKNLKEHIKNRHENMVFECAHCDEKFNSRYHIIDHLELKHGSNYTCKLCNFVFQSYERYKTHLTLHSSPKHLCPECGRLFGRSDYLNKHLAEVHDAAKCFICDYCGSKFARKGNLYIHIMKHLNNTLKTRGKRMKDNVVEAHTRHECA